MAVRLYCEAHASPGGSEGGPSFRFANAIRELVLDESEAFTPSAVRAEFRRINPRVRRTRGLPSHLFYENTLYAHLAEPVAIESAPKVELDKS